MAPNVRKRCLLIAAFLAAAFAGDRVLSFIAGRVVQSSEFRLSQIYRGSIDADILILGNSRGVHSLFGPRLAEVTCRPVFNAAYNGLSAPSMSVMFKDFLERNRKPKFVLVEISAGAAQDRSAAELKTYAAVSPRLAQLFATTNPRYRYWSSITRLYHFNTELFLRSLYYMGHDDQRWIIEDRSVTPDMIRAYRGLDDTGPDLRDRRGTALHKLAANAREAGVQPVFYIAPYHPVVFERSPELAEWARQQREVVDQAIPVLDFSHAIRGTAPFADPIHLNKAGSYQLIEALMRTQEGAALRRCRAEPQS